MMPASCLLWQAQQRKGCCRQSWPVWFRGCGMMLEFRRALIDHESISLMTRLNSKESFSTYKHPQIHELLILKLNESIKRWLGGWSTKVKKATFHFKSVYFDLKGNSIDFSNQFKFFLQVLGSTTAYVKMLCEVLKSAAEWAAQNH